MSRKRWIGLQLIPLILFLIPGVAYPDQIDDVLSQPLKADEGILVISVDTEVPFRALKFRNSSKVFDDDEAENTPSGKSLQLVTLPAGHYKWLSVVLGTSNFTRGVIGIGSINGHKYEFDIKAGKVNYPGDFVVQSQYGERLTNALREQKLNTSAFLYNIRYYIDLKDRVSILLENLTPAQRIAIARLGFEYAGPGKDPFPAYYLTLPQLQASVK